MFLDTSSMSGCRTCKQMEAVGQAWVWDRGGFGLVWNRWGAVCGLEERVGSWKKLGQTGPGTIVWV